MIFRSLVISALLGTMVSPVYVRSQEREPSPSVKASASTVYLQPMAFTELPGDVTRELQRRGCRIPQQAGVETRSNVIRGEFARSGQMDWAVLCSVHGTSRILVFWHSDAANPSEIAPSEDRIYLQKNPFGRLQFLRVISAVGMFIEGCAHRRSALILN
jgi:hypothetical protein